VLSCRHERNFMNLSRSVVVTAWAALGIVALPGAARAGEEGPDHDLQPGFRARPADPHILVKEGESERVWRGSPPCSSPTRCAARSQDPKGSGSWRELRGGPAQPGVLLRQNEGKVVAFQSLNPGLGRRRS